MSRMLPLRASRTRGSSSTGCRRTTQTERPSGSGVAPGTTTSGSLRQTQAEQALIDRIEGELVLGVANIYLAQASIKDEASRLDQMKTARFQRHITLANDRKVI